ncbi:unnamed protein product [Amaranthus hypochondriacus]
MRSLIDLFLVASMPILKVLLITALGLFLALNRIDILGETATHNLNKVVFYVFSPALVVSNLAKSVTIKSFLTQWFMIPNVLLTFLIGSAMGWVLAKLTKAPKHVKGLIVASCSAGNLGNFPLIILPAMCKEKGSPFGAPDVCERNGLAYASLSLALGTVYFWLYAYNIVRITSKEVLRDVCNNSKAMSLEADAKADSPLHSSDHHSLEAPSVSNSLSESQIKKSGRLKQGLRKISKELNLKAVLAPSTIGAIVGFIIGMITPLRKLLMDKNAPLHVVGDTSFMIGDASIPCSTIILGANLLRGIKGSGIKATTIIGVVAVRSILLPLLGILIVKAAIIAGTVTELFGVGQKECSVILLWTNVLSPISLTLWSTFFLWLLS